MTNSVGQALNLLVIANNICLVQVVDCKSNGDIFKALKTEISGEP